MLGTRMPRPLARLAVGLLLVLGAGAALTACGGSDDDGSTVATADNGILVEDARGLMEKARRGLVYSTVETPTEVSQVEPYGDWRGPTSAPTPAKGVKVQAISCADTAPGCRAAAQAVVKASKALGWDAQAIDGGGTPQAWSQAFQTALQRKPDVIITVAIPTVAIADSLAEARKRDVMTVAAAESPSDSGESYDAYAPYPYDAIWGIAAWTAIAEADGKANEIVPQETDFPMIPVAVSNYEAIMSKCEECSVEVLDWQLSDALDAASVDRIVGGALKRNPDATGIYLGGGYSVPATSQTVQQNDPDGNIQVGVSLADPVAVQLVAQGAADYTIGTSAPWAGWAAVDQAIRGLAGEPTLQGTEIGLGIGELTTETAPESGDFDDWAGTIDFESKYLEIWGVN